MNGQEINDKLERGLFGSYKIKHLAGTWSTLERPSDMTCANGVNDSVTQQARSVDAVWNPALKRLTIQAAAGGPGLWIPYLGNGMPNAVGVAVTAGHGLGTYTPVVGAAGASWVATGPFSGCHIVTLTVGGGKVFAHVISPAAGYPCAPPATQTIDIAYQVGAVPPTPAVLAASKVSGGGIGFVFWTRLHGAWWRRVIKTGAGSPAKVISVERRQLC